VHVISNRILSVAFAAVAFTVGCASAGTATKAQHNVLTSAELVRAGDVSLYDALRQLRPAFLMERRESATGTAVATTQVYIGAMQMEGVEHLREIMAKNVEEVRFLDPREANARFGTNRGGSAIVVTLK
jgi:hypothetical protein